MRKSEIEHIEIQLFLEAMYERYGYDFRNYAHASVKRRILGILEKSDHKRICELIPQILYDEAFFVDIVHDFSITVTEMFRDPGFFLAFREKVVPYLKTYPYVKIWHAGCASGEEVYSLAILLKEEGLYKRATIYATDFNDAALEKARSGIYALEDVRKFTSNYLKAGGTSSFSDYYHAQYDSAILNTSLRGKILFANHNLVTDAVFSEMHVVLCRNVLIYFNGALTNRVLNLFNESLIHKGFLCLGSNESLHSTEVFDTFTVIDRKQKIYRKK